MVLMAEQALEEWALLFIYFKFIEKIIILKTYEHFKFAKNID